MIARCATLALALAALLVRPAAAESETLVRIGTTLAHVPLKTMVDMRFQHMVRQTQDLSCGAAALATLLKYFYGEEVSEKDMIDAGFKVGDEEKIKRDGFSMLELKRISESRGFVAQGFRIPDPEKLAQLKIPAITLINVRGYNHFVVIKGVANGQVFFADPAFGNRSRPIAAFAETWNNVILAVFSENRSGRNTFTLDQTLKAPMEQTILLLGRNLNALPRGPNEL